MEKSVYNMKAEKIQKQVKQGDYATAAKICDTIDWTQVRSARMLSLVSSVYEHVGKYDTAIDILLMAYEEAPVGRRFLYKLTELALAAGNVREAEEYYKNYIHEAADDSSRYILRYKIAKTKNEPIEKRISILSTYKQLDFDERWATELAKLYDEAGESEKCTTLCEEIILWFGAGPYVDKCKEMKAKYEIHPSYVYDQTTPLGEEDRVQDTSKSIPETVAISGTAAESGQQVSALDMSVFRPEDGDIIEEKEEESFANTRRISAKDDFSRTRIFDKLPVNTSELKLFKTVTAGDSEKPIEVKIDETEESEEPAKVSQPKQMELTWDEGDEAAEEEAKRVIFIGTDSPSDAIEKAIEKIKDAHKKLGTPIAGVTKIAGPKLNTKGLISSLETLAKKDVIVLGASRLSEAVLLELKEVTEKIDLEKIFVLADSEQGIVEAEKNFENAVVKEEEPEAEVVIPEEAEAVEPEIEIAEFEEEPAEETKEESPIPEVVLPDENEQDDSMVAHDFKSAEEEINLDEVAEDILASDPKELVEETEETFEEAEEVEDTKEDDEAEETEIFEEVEEDEAAVEDHEESPEEKAKNLPTRKEDAYEEAAKKGKLTPEQFLERVLKYAYTIDCVLEKGAEKELLKFFKELDEEGELLDRQLAEDMVEDAANAAEKHSFGNLFHKRYAGNGDLIIRAKHFV